MSRKRKETVAEAKARKKRFQKQKKDSVEFALSLTWMANSDESDRWSANEYENLFHLNWIVSTVLNEYPLKQFNKKSKEWHSMTCKAKKYFFNNLSLRLKNLFSKNQLTTLKIKPDKVASMCVLGTKLVQFSDFCKFSFVRGET